ncbi:MAG: hypothetical protein QM477_03895 [Planctomycetota bacterium]
MIPPYRAAEGSRLAILQGIRDNARNMGWFQRLFSGAHDDDGSNRGQRSPEQARVSAEEFTYEIRALKNEIKALRENLGGGGRDVVRGDRESSGARRGGRGRGRSGGGDRDERYERDSQGRGRNGNRRDHAPRRNVPREIPDDAPTGLLVEYLKTRKVVVYEGQDDLDRNEAFEHLARHLGTHFDLLAEFYEKVKRCVATGRGQRIDIDGYSQASRSAAVQFGTLLHRHGMLKDFYYHRSPKRQLRVIPTKDGQIGQFLTGGWLEIYVFAVLAKRLRASMEPDKFQLLANVKGMLEDGREFEADLMAAVGDKFFWLECKTGNWQDYSARFRGLVKIFGVERTSAGLLLIRPPDSATRKRATDMLDMTLLSLAEVDDFISVFLGEELTGDSRRHAAPPVLEEENSSPRRERPARSARRPRSEEAEGEKEEKPERRIEGDEKGEEGDAAPRRRRRRRGGRGRGRNRGTQGTAEGEEAREGADAETSTEKKPAPRRSAPQEAAAEKPQEPLPKPKILGMVMREETPAPPREKKGSLNEPIPIAKLDDEADASAEVKEEAAERAPRRRRRRRSSSAGSPFADDAKSEDSQAKDEETAKAEEVSEEAKAEKLGALADAVAEKVDPKPKARTRRQPKSRGGKAKQEEVAEETAEEVVAEEKPKPKPRAASKPKAAAEPRAKAEPKPKPTEEVVAAAPKAKPEAAPKPKAVAKPKPAAKAKPEPVEPIAQATKSGVTIAPDLAAMMAGGSKPKKD